MPRQIAYIGLGSNLGNRRALLGQAVDTLAQSPDVSVTDISDFVETAPVDCPPDTPAFLNAVVRIETGLSPRALLDRLQAIERSAGRNRSAAERNTSRTLDLDLLLFGQDVIDEPGLVVPHPRMHTRRFVLEPLAQIDPEARHPGQERTVGQLLAAL